MANVTPMPNGTYLIRVSCGTDARGHAVTKSKIFKPLKPHLTYSKLNREIEIFTKAFEEEIARFGPEKRPDKMQFATFCDKYPEIKKGILSPNTFPFYERVIREQLIPMFGTLKLRDIRTYHVQQYFNISARKRNVRTARRDTSTHPPSSDTPLFCGRFSRWLKK